MNKTPIDLWSRLETLFTNKVAPSLAYIKAALFTFRLDMTKSIDENLDDFLKLIMTIKDTKYFVDETSIVMILLNVLPDNYQPVKMLFNTIVPFLAMSYCVMLFGLGKWNLRNLK